MMKLKWKSVMMACALAAPTTALIGTTTGCSSTPSERSVGEYIDDKIIAERVDNALDDDPQFKLDHVEVLSFQGTVQLSGFVETEAQKARAGEIAKNIQGVKGVDNKITINPPKSG